jgi:hypothetical protein
MHISGTRSSTTIGGTHHEHDILHLAPSLLAHTRLECTRHPSLCREQPCMVGRNVRIAPDPVRVNRRDLALSSDGAVGQVSTAGCRGAVSRRNGVPSPRRRLICAAEGGRMRAVPRVGVECHTDCRIAHGAGCSAFHARWMTASGESPGSTASATKAAFGESAAFRFLETSLVPFRGLWTAFPVSTAADLRCG